MFKLDKEKILYISIGVLVLTVVILVFLCIMKNKEGFTDLGSKKKVLVSDENGNIELYDVGNFLNELTKKYEGYDAKIKSLEDKVASNTNRIQYHFPKGTDEFKLANRTITWKEMAFLRGEGDFYIKSPEAIQEKQLLASINDRQEARFVPWNDRDNLHPNVKAKMRLIHI